MVLNYNAGPKTLSVQGPGNDKGEVKLEGENASLLSEEVLVRLRKGKRVCADVEVEKLGGKNWKITAVAIV